ncbi:hypothetical protein AAG570_007792 [Ranatra chinensis]|uniref:Uncharacterized protein n=1 Tax=Ranatra chinensis TaxID=642074 RepID=A0ABD0XUP0_9HEMI
MDGRCERTAPLAVPQLAPSRSIYPTPPLSPSRQFQTEMSPCRWSHVFYLFLFYPVLLALKPTSSKSPESTLLLDLNGSRTDGAPTTALRTLGPDSLTVLRVVDVPNDAGFIVVQSHSHLYDLTLSYTSPPAEKSNVNGTNLGLVYYITNTPAATSYLFNRNPFNVTVLIAVTSYSNKVHQYQLRMAAIFISSVEVTANITTASGDMGRDLDPSAWNDD